MVAVAAIVVLSGVNYVGVKHGTLVQTAFTIGKLAAIALIVVVGAALGTRLPEHFVASASSTDVGVSDFLTALVAGLFAFGGGIWSPTTRRKRWTRSEPFRAPSSLGR